MASWGEGRTRNCVWVVTQDLSRKGRYRVIRVFLLRSEAEDYAAQYGGTCVGVCAEGRLVESCWDMRKDTADSENLRFEYGPLTKVKFWDSIP